MLKYFPRWLKDLLKRSDTIVALHSKASWQYLYLKDWWATRVWKYTSEVMTPLGFKLASGIHPAYRAMREGKFEVEETDLISQFLGHVDVFVDVGANLGYYTCLAALHGKKVVAFEPQQQNLRCLIQNILVNGYQEQVEIFPLALSESPGVLTLYGASGPSASLVRGWAGYPSVYRQTVPVSTLDNVLGARFIEQQLFVKIDVEGAEYQVLLGGQATIGRAKKPVWLLEICLQEFHPLGANPDYEKIFSLFCEQGYQAFTATIPPRSVRQDHVRAWAEANSNGSTTFNYVFVSAEMAQANFST